LARTKKRVKPLDYTFKPNHWIGLKPNPKKWVGFVYEIKNLITGQLYIGRKLYWEHRKLKRVKQSKWGIYTGSSKRLNKDIEELGLEHFQFKILRHYPDKSSLRYGESEMIVKKGALTKHDQDGNKMYYNGQVDKCYSPTCYYEGGKLVYRPK
jgi:hypothetical protein